MPPRRAPSRRTQLKSTSTVPAVASTTSARKVAKAAALRSTQGGGVRKPNILHNARIRVDNLRHFSRVCRPGMSCAGMKKIDIQKDLRSFINKAQDPALVAKLTAEIDKFLLDPKKSREDRIIGNQSALAGKAAAAATGKRGGGGGFGFSFDFPVVMATVLGVAGGKINFGHVSGDLETIRNMYNWAMDGVNQYGGWFTSPKTEIAKWVLFNVLTVYNLVKAWTAAKARNDKKEENQIKRQILSIIVATLKTVVWIWSNYWRWQKFKGGVRKIPKWIANAIANLMTSLSVPTSSNLPVPIDATHINHVANGIRMSQMRYPPPSTSLMGVGRMALKVSGAQSLLDAVSTASTINAVISCVAVAISVMICIGAIHPRTRKWGKNRMSSVGPRFTRGAKRARNAARQGMDLAVNMLPNQM